MFSINNSSSRTKKKTGRTRSTPSRSISTPSRTRSTPSRTRSTQKSNTKKKTSKNNSNITYTIPDTIPDVYTFFSHSCNFINKFKSSFNNEGRIGRKIVPKNCILITYGDIGDKITKNDKNFIEFLKMFKSGDKYFKEPLKYETELKKIFGKKLHFHYSNYYGKKPLNSKKKFYANIKYTSNMLFGDTDYHNELTLSLIEMFTNLFTHLEPLKNLVNQDISNLSDIEKADFKEMVEIHNISINGWRFLLKELLEKNFNINIDDVREAEIRKFIDTNDIYGFIEYCFNYLSPDKIYKTGLYKLKTDLIVTDNAKYYLKSSEIKQMFKDSLIKTKFNFNYSGEKCRQQTLLLKLEREYPININQSDLFKSHPGIYYNFSCRGRCNYETPNEDVRIQRAFSNAVQNNTTIMPQFPLDPGIIASTPLSPKIQSPKIPSPKIPSHYNSIIKEMNQYYK